MAKAATRKLISTLPHADSVNYVFKRRVTRNLPRSDADFRQQVDETLRHHHVLERWSTASPAQIRAYEFGAGWDLIKPIVLTGLGVAHQTLVDIRENLRWSELDHTR